MSTYDYDLFTIGGGSGAIRLRIPPAIQNVSTPAVAPARMCRGLRACGAVIDNPDLA